MKWTHRLGSTALAMIAALLVSAGLMLLVNAPPREAFSLLIDGSVSGRKIPDTLMAWAPLMLTSAGLVITYTADHSSIVRAICHALPQPNHYSH